MRLIDRYIAMRFFSNFLLLFGLLFVFVISIDVIVQFDEFSEAAAREASAHGRSYPLVLVHAILEFHGPRIFQFYAFMVGIVGVAAAGFTIAQMHRAKELVAIMAAGVSLRRVAVIVLSAEASLVAVQLIDQEFLLPRLAPMLVRQHQEILRPSVDTFSVPLTRDASNNLLRARSLDPSAGKATGLLILVRTEDGPALERITASSGQWDSTSKAWILKNGVRIVASANVEPGMSMTTRSTVTRFETDLSPQRLLTRRSLQFAQLLSSAHLTSMASSGGVDQSRLTRVVFGRYSGAFVNLLVLALALPFFLMREPANMLIQSMKASAVVLPVLIGSIALMSMKLPGLSPAVGAFLPVIVLLPVAFGRVAFLKT